MLQSMSNWIKTKCLCVIFGKRGILLTQDLLPHQKEERPRQVRDMGMLQSSLDECLRWYICLANEIAAPETLPVFLATTGAPAPDRNGEPLWMVVHPSQTIIDIENGLEVIMGRRVKLTAPVAEDSNTNVLDLCAIQNQKSLRVVLQTTVL